MARVRTIERNPEGKNYYLIDANFLANKFIVPANVSDHTERAMVEASQCWWEEIERQLKARKAFLYVPDVCVAETFRVLAKKYYKGSYFASSGQYKRARDSLASFMHIPPKVLKSKNRVISVHDVPTSRDVVVAVDRFNEMFFKHKLSVSVVDVLILATAKYLTDFFHIPAQSLFLVTLDKPLWKGSKRLSDVPSAFNPAAPNEVASKVFV